jgi:hypothetical protein
MKIGDAFVGFLVHSRDPQVFNYRSYLSALASQAHPSLERVNRECESRLALEAEIIAFPIFSSPASG